MGTIASGGSSHSEGALTTASGAQSHAEGVRTIASSFGSHAEGISTKASGFCSHAEGAGATASGDYSHAEGYSTIAASAYQHVQGKYNVEDTNNTYAHIVGGGADSNNRKNIQTIDWNGNEAITGSLTLGKDSADEVELTAETVKNLITNTIEDVQINGTSIVEDGVANIPVANNTTYGVAKGLNNYGVWVSNGFWQIYKAANADISAGVSNYKPIVPSNQDRSTFYGLAKAAGDTTQSASSNAVGTYTDEAKSAIQNMLDVPSADDVVTDVKINDVSVVTDGVAEIPIARSQTPGVIKVLVGDHGVQVSSNGILQIASSKANDIKAGTQSFRPIAPNRQHESTFYGLAKAAGDATQSASSNAVGDYTEDAKSAISEMLGGSVAVSGTTPAINAKAGIRYVCGEVSTLDITLPASGIVDVVFTSGSTPTVLTITPPTGQTVKWANGFDSASLDVNTTYEVNIADGLGVAVGWT